MHKSGYFKPATEILELEPAEAVTTERGTGNYIVLASRCKHGFVEEKREYLNGSGDKGWHNYDYKKC